MINQIFVIAFKGQIFRSCDDIVCSVMCYLHLPGLLVCEEKLELIKDFVTTVQAEAEEVSNTVRYF